MLTPHVTPFTYKWISSSTNINVEKCFWCILRQKQNKTTTHIALQCVKYKHSRTTHEANSQVSINMRAIHPCLSISETQTINDGIPFFSFLNARNRLHVLTYAAWGRCFSTAALRGHASALHLSLGCASSTLLVSGSGSGNAGVFSEKFDNFDSRETNCGETWRWVTEPCRGRRRVSLPVTLLTRPLLAFVIVFSSRGCFCWSPVRGVKLSRI